MLGIKKEKMLLYLFFFLFLVVNYNSTFNAATLPGVGVGIITLLEVMIIIIGLIICIGRNFWTVYFKWLTLFGLYFVMTILWSYNTSLTINALKSTFIIYFIILLISISIEDEKDIRLLLDLNFIAICLCGLYVAIFFRGASLTGLRIGEDIEGLDKWNANDIGLKMCVGIGMCMYYLDSKRHNKTFVVLLLLFFFYITFYTGSRKALVFSVLIVAFYLFLKSKGMKKTRTVIVVAIVIALVYYLVMNVPTLYQVLGRRIDNFVSSLRGVEVNEYSMTERNLMNTYGVQWFKEKPIIGYGLDNYSALFGDKTGLYTYSHNNFVELLVNGGIIAFCIFYSSYLYIIFKSRRAVFKERDHLSIILFSLNVITVLLHYALVSYTTVLFMLLQMMTMVYFEQKEKWKRDWTFDNIIC